MDRSKSPGEAKSRLPIFNQNPERAAQSQMAAFTRALQADTGQPFTRYSELHDFSIREYRLFWKHFLQWTPGLQWSGQAEPVCAGEVCEHARFFPEVTLNYADNLLGFSIAPADAPALTACHADGRRVRLTRGELRTRVARLADALTQLGLREGDRVAGVMRNDADAIVTALAVTAIGATLSTAAPEMGIETLLDRFTQLEPRFLFAHTAAQPFDTGTPLARKIALLADALPSLTSVVSLDGDPSAVRAAPPVNSLDALLAAGDPARVEWKRFGFNHPLFVMFSSGTTGKPKCIVHGTGGSLVEHLKEHRLHCELRPGDRMYFHTSCAWMMWNWQLSALASGVEVVTYDGPIGSVDTLWRLVAEERVNVFGTSPAYLKMCEDAGLVPSREFDLRALRSMMSTGAILFDAQFEWVRDNVKPLQLQSISGGTDILGCFVLGHPGLPVYAGEAQCKSLGLDVQAWRDGARAQGVGELVCVNPFPSRPLGFLNDPDGERFHKAYFSANPGVWTHGDQIEFPPEGTARLHGRSDGVLVVRGINVGPGEIYRVLNDIPEIREGIVVQQRMRDTTADAPGKLIGERLVLLVTLKPGARLCGALIARIRRDLVRRTSAAHVPDVIAAVDDLPVTHSGKLTEAAVRNAVNGLDVTNAAALRNPASLDAIRRHPALQHRSEDLPQTYATREELERLLQTKWEQLFAFAPIGRDDNFFELGGHSLLAARLLAELQPVTGRTIPLATMLRAPTIAKLADVIDNGALPQTSEVLVPMREGEGAPLFLVHSVTGSVLECTRLIGSMRKQRPVYGLQALGLDGETPPQRRVEDMAKTYVEQIRKVQPNGPYALAGFSFGGLVALEIAQQLFGAGEQTEFVCLLDTYVQERWLPWFALLQFRRDYASRLWKTLASMSPRERTGFALAKFFAATNKVAMRLGRVPRAPSKPAAAGDPMPPVLRRMRDTFRTAMNNYRPRPYEGGRIVYVRAASREEDRGDPLPLWRKIARSGLTVAEVPGNHAGVIEEPGVYAAAAALDRDYGVENESEVKRRAHRVMVRGA
ncbi:acetoacetate--CoA ligase [Caballeronia sp. J97]|uniref:acetoacetate--CoA ligase n=1 Tax=Caballeronia sp. J97 TaxID=2805429 RepID=UPI002AB0D09C|nr:acetoacetate--CoA ligase [Caballeronia sp. J97]